MLVTVNRVETDVNIRAVRGSLSPEVVTVRLSCCQPSLVLALTDLAGNTVTCTAGPVTSAGGTEIM